MKNRTNFLTKGTTLMKYICNIDFGKTL